MVAISVFAYLIVIGQHLPDLSQVAHRYVIGWLAVTFFTAAYLSNRRKKAKSSPQIKDGHSSSSEPAISEDAKRDAEELARKRSVDEYNRKRAEEYRQEQLKHSPSSPSTTRKSSSPPQTRISATEQEKRFEDIRRRNLLDNLNTRTKTEAHPYLKALSTNSTITIADIFHQLYNRT